MQNFEIIENKYGKILVNSTSKYVFYHTKKVVQNGAKMYLKQVEPTTDYISGMFESKHKENTYFGKTKTNKKVVLRLNNSQALLSIY